MTNPFRTDLIAIFVRRGHKGKEIVEEVREIEALLAPVLADAEKWRKAKEIIEDLTDPDDCEYDHHGYCQAHCWTDESPCPHKRAKELLALEGEKVKG